MRPEAHKDKTAWTGMLLISITLELRHVPSLMSKQESSVKRGIERKEDAKTSEEDGRGKRRSDDAQNPYQYPSVPT